MYERKEHIVRFPNKHSLSVVESRPSLEVNIDFLAMAIEAKKSFQEYEQMAVADIYSVFKSLVQDHQD